MHSAEAPGMVSQLPSHMGSPHPWIIIWRKRSLLFLLCLGNISSSSPPPYLSFESWQKSVSHLNLFCPNLGPWGWRLWPLREVKEKQQEIWALVSILSTGSSSLDLQWGKRFSLQMKACNVTLQSLPWALGHYSPEAELPTVEKSKLAKVKKDKVPRPSSFSLGLHFCSTPGMSTIPSLCSCSIEAVVQVHQGSANYGPGTESTWFCQWSSWRTASPICGWINCAVFKPSQWHSWVVETETR